VATRRTAAASNNCEECLTDANCANNVEKSCNPGNSCVECIDAHCSQGQTCDGDWQCN
jgi:hypothetical protein